MAKSTWIIGGLSALLVATNAWWAYNSLEAGITYNYSQVSLENNREALAQALAVIETAAREGATSESIIQAALAEAGDGAMRFEKEGYVWVGSIGLEFDSSGRLTSAVRSWSPP